MNAELINDDGTSNTDETAMRQWTTVKNFAALIVICGVLLGCAGTVVAMIESFRIAAEGAQPVPVDSLAASIRSSLRFGAWLTPIVLCSAILWFVARAKLRTISRTLQFSTRNDAG